MKELETDLAAAVRHFWRTREKQAKNQGARTGKKDQGGRAAVTGGAQMDGFVTLVSELLAESGLPDATTFCRNRIELRLPGFFRPIKEWDLLIVADDQLVASMEFKSHVGSFGNNYNNRVEEAIGNATDFWTAYREGAFRESARPWLGYLILLEESPQSTKAVKTPERHFKVFEDFRNASYAKRYELFCLKLVRERLYDATCLLLSDQVGGLKGRFKEPNAEIGFQNFVASLIGRAMAFVKTRDRRKR